MGSPSKAWLRPLLWALLAAVLAGVAAAAAWQRYALTARQGGGELAGRPPRPLRATMPPRSPALPVLGQVPAFSMTERDGRTVRLADLAGAPWIADFVFTSCGSSCPMLSERMARLDRELPGAAGGGPPIRLVSFSVDPATDTPVVLARYARSYRASGRWLFLTGDAGQVKHLVRDGFKLALEPGGTGGGEAILHSTRFVLVDGAGEIRGTYQAFDPDALRRLGEDARALAASR